MTSDLRTEVRGGTQNTTTKSTNGVDECTIPVSAAGLDRLLGDSGLICTDYSI